MENYSALVDDYDADGCRSSAESSEEFSFSTAMDLRKNLADVFDKQLSKPSLASTATESTDASVTNRIAQFEAATVAAKPPLPLRQQSNNIPNNQLAVYLRIRPPPSSDGKSTPCDVNTIEVLKPKHPNIHSTKVRTYPPAQSNTFKVHPNRESHDSCAKEYDFHQVLEPKTTQKTVYSMVATPLLQGLVDSTISNKSSASQSALLFSYGITNAGKTHTILGDLQSKNDAKWGILPRAISDIFDKMKQIPRTAGNFDLYISFFEIYNEQVYDLIPKKNDSKSMGLPPVLKVRERQGQTLVRGLTKHMVKDVNHGIELTVMANNRRHTSSNNLNVGSSRSHCVCQMQIVPRQSQSAKIRPQPSDEDSVASMNGYSTDEEATFVAKKKVSTLWIVDLAGSERSKRTGLGGSARQKEAAQINKSLMTLMRCLTILRESGRNNSSNVVPFRESKLTHVFMGHLTGPSASRTAMIVNVNPAIADFDETQHVLAYAAKAKMIQLDPEEIKKKRKQFLGDAYGMDGRKKNKTNTATHAAKRMVTKIAKRLSPKKIVKRLSPKKAVAGKKEKRKVVPVHNKPFTSEANEPKQKRQKTASTVASVPANKANEVKALELLQGELNITQGKMAQLEAEKADLLEELSTQERQIRLEVSQEMEERLRISRARHNEELARLRAQIQATSAPCRSTRKAQMDKAGTHIEELMDKVDECEEEMVRMRQHHTEELSKLKHSHQDEVSKLKVSLEESSKNVHPAAPEVSSKKIAELQRELDASQRLVERLEKSKVELIENYEKLLNEGNEEEGDENESEEEEENRPPTFQQRLFSSKSSNSRRVLGKISGNVSPVPEKKGGQWMFPKKPTARDQSGAYRRPLGRAPQGREWDEAVGAWKLQPSM